MSQHQREIRYQHDPFYGVSFVREGEGDGDGEGTRRDGDGDGNEGGHQPHAPGDDPEALRKEVAALRKREKETAARAKKANERLERMMAEMGGGEEVEQFREWKKNREQEEEDRKRREGEFDALEKTLRGKVETLESTLATERSEREREDVTRELLTSSIKLKALDARQIDRIYGPDFHKKDGKVVHKTAFNEDGDPMSPSEFLEQQKAGPGSNLFETNRRGGSGAGAGESGDSGAAVQVRMVNGQLSPEQQAIYDAAKKDGKEIQINRVQ
jgi:hypothetical protein